MSNQGINPLSVSLTQEASYAPKPQNQPVSDGVDFQLLLTTMLLEQLGNPLGGQTSKNNDMSSILSLLMGALGDGNGISGLLGEFINPVSSVDQAARLQINQFDAEKQVGGDGVNSNCGPTSLVMALRGLGLSLPGEASTGKVGELVDLARKVMTHDSGRDGVTGSGKRAEYEHNFYTDFDDMKRGARAAGASTRMIAEDAQSILSALKSGARVIVSGTFSGKSNLPWTGDRGPDNNGAPGNATKHIVTVSGYNQETGRFIINDPARRTPVEVTGAQLESFMSGNAGAMAVHRG